MNYFSKEDYKAQAAFRHAIRLFLRLSEDNSREAGITPQQYQLLLAIKGMDKRDWATISELANSLQILNHSTVELCHRAEQIGLITTIKGTSDKRQVQVSLTKKGEDILAAIATKNRDQLRHLKDDITRLFILSDEEKSVQPDESIVMLYQADAIKKILEVNLSQLLDSNSPEYRSIRDEILEIIRLEPLSLSPKQNKLTTINSIPAVIKNTKEKSFDTEVIIIGAGPAGSTLGSYLSQAGIKNIIIEKALHPRSHVGESLSWSAMSILKEMKVLPVIEKELFLKKSGLRWIHWEDTNPINLELSTLGKNVYSLHVDRSKFDHLMLKYAQECGSKVITGVEVNQVNFDDKGFATGVTVAIGQTKFTLKSQLVVDASGRQTILGRQLKLIKPDLDFRQFAIHSWFGDVQPSKNRDKFTQIYLLPMSRSWIWQIPINKTITSVGLVTDNKHFIKSGQNTDVFFGRVLNFNSFLAQSMKNAKILRDFHTEGNYSYGMSKIVGNAWMLIGDAAFFIDPIFASGVGIALHSAKFAAETIKIALSTNDLSELCLQQYESMLMAGIGVWKKFVRLFYEVCPVFGRVVSQSEYKTQIIRLCEGEVYGATAEETLDKVQNIFANIKQEDFLSNLNSLDSTMIQ